LDPVAGMSYPASLVIPYLTSPHDALPVRNRKVSSLCIWYTCENFCGCGLYTRRTYARLALPDRPGHRVTVLLLCGSGAGLPDRPVGIPGVGDVQRPGPPKGHAD